MELGLQGQSVTAEDFGYTFSLSTDGGYIIQIGSSFFLDTSGQSYAISPSLELSKVAVDGLGSLLNQTLTSAVAEKSGVLIIAFANGSRLRVEPDESYEAWTISGPRGVKVVCMPGGELAVWSAEDDNET